MKSSLYCLYLLLLGMGLLPFSVHAATLSFDTPPGTVSVGDTVVVRAYLDSGDDALNALDGTIALSSPTASFSISEVNLANSALTVWAKNPVLSADKKTVTFTGGTPGGIPATHALVVHLLIVPTQVGTISVQAPSAVAYKNDGKGTQVPVTVTPFSFTVSAQKAGATPHNQWQELVGTDTTPPQPFTLTLGSDPSVFEGKKFIAFETTDAESGLDHYEVTEGAFPPVRAEHTYVLREQTAPETITVSAYDKAGNVRTASLATGTGATTYLPWLVALGLIVLGLFVLLILRNRKRL